MIRVASGIQKTSLTSLRDREFIDKISRHQEFFNDPPDTTLLMRGIRHISLLSKKLGFNNRIVDLGCGISYPLSTAIQEGLLNQALGIEINENAVQKGIEIARFLGVYNPRKYHIAHGDITNPVIQKNILSFNPTGIVANLPYLPEGKRIKDVTTDAGSDGTMFVKLTFRLAHMTNVPFVSINFSSLTTPELLFSSFEEHDMLPQKLFVYKAPFGERTKHLYKEGDIRYEAGHFYYLDKSAPLQLIMNIILIRKDLPFSSIKMNEIRLLMQDFIDYGKITIKQEDELRNPSLFQTSYVTNRL